MPPPTDRTDSTDRTGVGIRDDARDRPDAGGDALRVGVMVPTLADAGGRVDVGRIVDAARIAEAAGFDGVHVGDHLLHPHPMLDAVVALTALATATERIDVGPCVLLLALRQRLSIAKQLAGIAALAPGRLRLGVGVGGEYPEEFAAVGIPMSERGRRLEEAVTEVRSLLATGRDDRYPDRALAPAVDEPVPILFAGRKDVALRRAARLGDGWIGYLLSPAGFERRRALLLDELAGHADRQPAGRSFSFGMLLPVHVAAPSSSEAEATAEAAAAWARLTDRSAGFPGHLFAAGPPAVVAARIGEFVERGATDVVLAPADQGQGYLDQVRLLATEVLPRLRRR